MPSSSKSDEEINGYVEISPVVNMFLFVTNLISSLFCIIGRLDKKLCSSLKYALLVPYSFAFCYTFNFI